MKVASVSFKEKGKEYFFVYDKKLNIQNGDSVVVKTSGGLELATVINNHLSEVAFDDLMPIVRKATKKDLSNHERNIIDAKQAELDFQKILEDHPDLEMNLVEAKYNLDRSKILFMYVSDDRVDFRNLLKSLASHFKIKIELKQIGSRDKAKLVGGLGPCGMETCCSRYIKEFDNISINMAKNQMLSLNPIKISGLCGRLLCCLKYENDFYVAEKKNFPKIGSKVKYEDHTYRVGALNILMNEVRIENENAIKMVNKDDLTW